MLKPTQHPSSLYSDGNSIRQLNFRCTQCGQTTNVTAVWREDQAATTVACSTCGRRYDLSSARARNHSDHSYYEHVKKYAQQKGLDLASAYSVAEGIMTLSQARGRQGRAPGARAATRTISSASVLLLALIMAAPLAAYTARVWNEQTGPSPYPNRPVARAPEPTPASPTVTTSPRAPAIVTRTDDAGNLIEISGPDPSSVLRAFCGFGEGAERLEPVGLAKPPPPSSTGVRLGIYRDHDHMGAIPAIRIRRDLRTRRWVSGDGRGPIAGVDITSLVARTKVVPLNVQ